MSDQNMNREEYEQSRERVRENIEKVQRDNRQVFWNTPANPGDSDKVTKSKERLCDLELLEQFR